MANGMQFPTYSYTLKVDYNSSMTMLQKESKRMAPFKDLPEKAKNYIYALEDFIGAKISSVSTSPERDDTILIEDPFKA